MSEATEQQAIIQYCEYRHFPIFAIPNGGRRNPKEAHFLKLSGVKAGVPDMCIPVARRGYYGMYIELKVGKNKPTESQTEWINTLTNNGYYAIVCYGQDEAIQQIEWYFDEEKERN